YRRLSVSTPLTFPRQVSPEYGTRIEVAPISAVPFKVMLQPEMPGALATPWAFQSIVEPVRLPWAVPVSFRSFAHVALNEPRADVAVCSVTFHLKSAQVLGVGIRLDDVQLPISDRLPAADGLVGDFPLSYPNQAGAEPVTAGQRARVSH